MKESPFAADDATTTAELHRWRQGDEVAAARLIERFYPDLSNLARSLLRDHVVDFQPSDLLQELYLKLRRQHGSPGSNRAQFFALAARFSRRLIADHLKTAGRLKRGAGFFLESVEDLMIGVPHRSLDLLALDEALDRLGEIDPTAVRVVELRFFGGLTVEECAEALELGPATVVRRWRYARAWLRQNLAAERLEAPAAVLTGSRA